MQVQQFEKKMFSKLISLSWEFSPCAYVEIMNMSMIVRIVKLDSLVPVYGRGIMKLQIYIVGSVAVNAKYI